MWFDQGQVFSPPVWRETTLTDGLPGGLDGKEPACNVGDLDSIPGLGGSPGEGKGYPLLAWRIPWT